MCLHKQNEAVSSASDCCLRLRKEVLVRFTNALQILQSLWGSCAIHSTGNVFRLQLHKHVGMKWRRQWMGSNRRRRRKVHLACMLHHSVHDLNEEVDENPLLTYSTARTCCAIVLACTNVSGRVISYLHILVLKRLRLPGRYRAFFRRDRTRALHSM